MGVLDNTRKTRAHRFVGLQCVAMSFPGGGMAYPELSINEAWTGMDGPRSIAFWTAEFRAHNIVV